MSPTPSRSLAPALARLICAGLVLALPSDVDPAWAVPLYLLRLMAISELVRAAAALSVSLIGVAVAMARSPTRPATFSRKAAA